MVTAATLNVRQDGTGDFATIGGALAVATSGDIIRVGTGTYGESLTIISSVTLESESGASVTILDGLDSLRIMLIQGAAQVTVRGFTFTRAYSDNGSYGQVLCMTPHAAASSITPSMNFAPAMTFPRSS